MKQAKKGICPDHDLPYSALWAGGVRRGSLQLLVGSFKFRYMRAALEDLIDIIEGVVPRLPRDTVVVPVPTLAAHIRQRGYDHTRLLADLFSHRRGLVVQQLVERSSSSVQHRLGREQRIRAARDAFSVPFTVNASIPYLIIDDILTTGATVDAVARALRAAGARLVWVTVVVYQPLD